MLTSLLKLSAWSVVPLLGTLLLPASVEAATWDLVGTNPGVIFFGFGASPAAVPEPGVLLGLLSVGFLGGWKRR